jgi:hypothetical protein
VQERLKAERGKRQSRHGKHNPTPNAKLKASFAGAVAYGAIIAPAKGIGDNGAVTAANDMTGFEVIAAPVAMWANVVFEFHAERSKARANLNSLINIAR